MATRKLVKGDVVRIIGIAGVDEVIDVDARGNPKLRRRDRVWFPRCWIRFVRGAP